ncbi:MAG: exodeoxyribonuclease III [Elusimicrobia bacterium]|nr:exodeoxyribonuclease III [Elusimicrobiota bacterium]
MKLISWNVNGIRSALKRGFLETVASHRPDILCVQETKAPTEPLAIDLPGYFQFWNRAERPGYSGTAVFTKIKPRGVSNGIGVAEHDREGRVITAEYDDFFIVNVYVPNSKRGLERLPYRTRRWDVEFLKYLKRLEKKKPVIFCGDLNVAHAEIDLANPKANVHNHGFTPEERAGFDRIVKAGFVDTFREFVKEGGHYTWWSRLSDCRARDIGWRIDYACVSGSLRSRLRDAFILKTVLGSDHCPVGAVFS